MTLVQLTSPDLEPLGIADFKAHARIDTDAEDTLLAAMLLARSRRLRVSLFTTAQAAPRIWSPKTG